MLENINLKKKLPREEYKQVLPGLQRRLYQLEEACWHQGVPSIVIFEGWDAAGKGTAIATLTQRLDPRGFKLNPIVAPRTYEQQRPWLWRFWLKLPNRGEMDLFQIYKQKRPVVILLEGWDAAGKGGAIKRITEKLDPRGYVVYPISAPQGEDKTRHYLYRFWRRLPERGQIAIFDRSWYGRVLVERVEGFASEPAWKRAFKEINSFERQLRDFGMILAKFWLHVSEEEQLRRFEERKATGYKAWKLTEEDWRNRSRWSTYEQAVEEMLVKTSTSCAPWTLIEANDKYWARVRVLSKLVKILSTGLDYEPADPLRNKHSKAVANSSPAHSCAGVGSVPKGMV